MYGEDERLRALEESPGLKASRVESVRGTGGICCSSGHIQTYIYIYIKYIYIYIYMLGPPQKKDYLFVIVQQERCQQMRSAALFDVAPHPDGHLFGARACTMT